jgi:hypothetical protein
MQPAYSSDKNSCNGRHLSRTMMRALMRHGQAIAARPCERKGLLCLRSAASRICEKRQRSLTCTRPRPAILRRICYDENDRPDFDVRSCTRGASVWRSCATPGPGNRWPPARGKYSTTSAGWSRVSHLAGHYCNHHRKHPGSLYSLSSTRTRPHSRPKPRSGSGRRQRLSRPCGQQWLNNGRCSHPCPDLCNCLRPRP